MNVKDAIGTALDFERKVRDHYFKYAVAIEDAQGRKLFETLGREEQGHVDYLEHCLAEWQKSGKVPSTPLKSLLPKGVAWIAAERKKLERRPGKRLAKTNELEAVKLALQYEKETSAFYHDMVGRLRLEEQALFSQFLSIEDAHVALVQAQLDLVMGMGFWFDVMEFQLEAG